MEKIIQYFKLKILSVLAKIKRVGMIKSIIYSVVICLSVLYFVAFVMMGKANHKFVRDLCKEFVNGPYNMVVLIYNKFVLNKISYKTSLKTKDSEHTVSSLAPHEKDIQSVLDRLKQQTKIDEQLQNEFNSGNYSIENPLVVINPYGISPLTALVMFDTKEETIISLSINSELSKEKIKHNFTKEGYNTKHILPIYGLTANMDNKVKILCETKDGNKLQKTIIIKTEPLPLIFKKINLITYNNSDFIQSGFNFSYSSVDSLGQKYAFDKYGNIRWFFSDTYQFTGTNYNKGKSVYRTIGGYDFGEGIIIKESYLGRIEELYYVPEGLHHDVNITKNNSIIALSNHNESFEDAALEFNRDNGQIINFIDYRKLLPRGRRVTAIPSDPRDWAHINAIVSFDGDYISSSNFQSAVFRHTKDGKLKWILSDPKLYPTYWKQYLLKPIGSDFEYPYNQHAVEVLPDYDNNPNTVDVLLFDNGTGRNTYGKPLYSRLVHYRIDEKDKTVEQIWEYGKNRLELYSPSRGDADLLTNGNILGTFVRENSNGNPYCDTIYVEVNRDGQVMWECYATSNSSKNKYLDYRLERTHIYNSDTSYIDLFKKIKNFIPVEVMKKYGYEK